MKEPCELKIEIVVHLLKNCRKEINLRQFIKEIYRWLQRKILRLKIGFKAEIMKNIFIFTEPAYHLLGNNLLERHSVKSARCGHETVYHLGPKKLSLLPEECKEIDSLSIFKIKNSNWETDESSCRLCKTSGLTFR